MKPEPDAGKHRISAEKRQGSRTYALWPDRPISHLSGNQGNLGKLHLERDNLYVNKKSPVRRWERLDISFPVFARGTDAEGKEFVEFGTALNVSAGGMLLAVRKARPRGRVRLEIPNPPWLAAPDSHRSMEASTVWAQTRERFTLLGLKFLRPLQKLRTEASAENNIRGAAARK